jgi:hypothetical protein
MKSTPLFQDQEADHEFLMILRNMRNSRFEYPPDLRDTRRAAFMAQIEQISNGEIGDDAILES